jgi:integrase
MASLYPKKKSPFWYINFADPVTGISRNESTKLRRDNIEETRKARQRCAQATADELGSSPSSGQENWGSWVDSFFVVHYPNPLSLKRARGAWVPLMAYLRVKNIFSPRRLSHANCMDYLAWRTDSDQGKIFGLRKAKHNTARVELQFLSAIMREAVLRGKAIANPCLQLGIKRSKGKIKPEFREDQIRVIEKRLKAEAGKYEYNEAMKIAWDIAMMHLCRLRETCVPLEDVNLQEQTITFHTKGGTDQTKLLHPALIPLFRRLKKERRQFAYEMPNNWSKKWKYFFKRCGIPDFSFHSTRVTGVNTLRRKRVDQRISRDYVGHSSVIVNRGYERWRPEDHLDAVNALSRRPVSSSYSSGRARNRSS